MDNNIPTKAILVDQQTFNTLQRIADYHKISLSEMLRIMTFGVVKVFLEQRQKEVK